MICDQECCGGSRAPSTAAGSCADPCRPHLSLQDACMDHTCTARWVSGAWVGSRTPSISHNVQREYDESYLGQWEGANSCSLGVASIRNLAGNRVNGSVLGQPSSMSEMAVCQVDNIILYDTFYMQRLYTKLSLCGSGS